MVLDDGVDGESDAGAGHGLFHLMVVGLIERISVDYQAAPGSADDLVVDLLDAALAVFFGVDKAQHMSGCCPGHIESLDLGQESQPAEAQRFDLFGFQVCELAFYDDRVMVLTRQPFVDEVGIHVEDLR
jgi:hypothetical protein